MNFEDAKQLLNASTRWELRDHAFGDVEFGWDNAFGATIADGYSSGGKIDIEIIEGMSVVHFTGSEARELKNCGTVGTISRNDETGPEEFVESQTMPGLTLAGVLEELTQPPSHD